MRGSAFHRRRAAAPARVGLCLIALWAASVLPASAAPVPVVAATSYRARFTRGMVEVLARRGGVLVTWPVGVACTPADPSIPAVPAPARPAWLPVDSVVAGVPQWTWRWRFPAPHPFSEQVEVFRFLPDRAEVQVRVRWRTRSARLLRLVYGGRLAAGCCDLEGLWESREGPQEDAPWVLAPVPGVTTRTGETSFRRRVRTPSSPGRLRLLLGGVDDGDVARWGDREVGRTASDAVAGSWLKVRRYDFDAGPPGVVHEVGMTVSNTGGQGGLWRGPCVLGPIEALEVTPQRDGWWRATLEGRALHHWCPDRYTQTLRDRFTLSLTSVDRTRDVVPENVTTGGRFQIPPYLVAVEGRHGWWGLGTLDLPRAEDGLRIEWRDGSLVCPFLLATRPGAAPGAWTIGPRLAILPGHSKQDVLRRYRRAVAPVPPSPRHDWWSGPEYCTWGDQVYASRFLGASDVGTLTDERVRAWLAELDRHRLHAPLIVLDAGWWQLSREIIADLHAQGRHVLLWTQPHWWPDTTRHADWAMHDIHGRPIAYGPHNWILDYTVPEARRHMAESIRSYLSAAGWNADGLKLDFPYTAAPVWALHADPSWGAGEEYRARVLRFWYQQAKGVKPGALVTLGCTNPLFGRVQDVCRLNEDWTGDPETFRRRAAAVLALGEWVNCDDWNAYEHYLEPQAVERPVWGTLTLMSALYRGDRDNAPVLLSPAWTARLSAITRLARLAPVRLGQRCLYDPDAAVARRLTARGELVAAALPLQSRRRGAQAFVVQARGWLWITAVADGTVVVPVRAVPAGAVSVRHDGRRAAVPCRRVPAGIALRVQDAAGPIAYYEVRLEASSTAAPGRTGPPRDDRGLGETPE